ncbi:hypothetical protein AYO44_17680 [Planctomycetaceae bacterium SCGC AG-212-F19]|nr:hypothetical protein AYO44_17680 [Planctomycetaceae bacterium SCGC AG-212-F19]
MTEQEWLECTDRLFADPQPQKMLEFLRDKASHRKLRLFACACCRRIDIWLNDLSKRAVEVAEQFAGGLVSEQACIDCRDAAYDPRQESDHGSQPAYSSAVYSAAGPRENFIVSAGYAARNCRLVNVFSGTESNIQMNLLRDIFCNPFKPVSIDRSWLTSTVVSLAQAIYDERAFERMPVLADALEEAGYTSVEILEHCRQPGVHVRGCWLIDLLLQKE